MGKRSIGLLLALVLLTGLLPVPVQAAPAQKLAAITFDDGPGPYTDRLLDELAQRGVSVTFFMQGQNAARYPDVVKKAYEAGHQIASHTYSHPQLTALSPADIAGELSGAAGALNRAIGAESTYMLRPPYGSVNAQVLSALDVPAILWSVDTRDWESRNADAIYRHIVNDTRDGSIVLLHDVHAASIPGALRGIDALLAQGYELVTVSELLRRRGLDATPGAKYYSAPGADTLPGISPPHISAEPVMGGQRITLSAQEGAAVYYTADGSAPTSRSKQYTGPFLLESSAQLRAFAAFDLNGGRSQVSSLTVDIPRADAPIITPEEGFAVITGEGELRCTLDGTEPTADTPLCSGPIPLPAGTVVRAVSTRPGFQDSPVVSLLHSDSGVLFDDVRPDQWFYRDADEMAARGLMDLEGLSFHPERPAVRRELALALYRLSAEPAIEGRLSFPDLSPDDSAYAALLWAAEQGLLSGFDDGTLRPDAPLTREQLIAVLFRAEKPEEAADPAALSRFADGETVHPYARDAMAYAVSKGILNGVSDTRLAPGGTVTRAQLSGILRRWQAL